MSQSSSREILAEMVITEGQSFVFYERLAHLFRDRQDIASFWRAMAADEKQHKDTLTKLLDNLGPDDLSETADSELHDRMLAMREFMEQKAETIPENLEEAYQLADECEQLEVIPLILLLAKSVVPDKVRDPLLEKQIEVHNKRLSAFGKVTGGAEKRRAIPSRP